MKKLMYVLMIGVVMYGHVAYSSQDDSDRSAYIDPELEQGLSFELLAKSFIALGVVMYGASEYPWNDFVQAWKRLGTTLLDCDPGQNSNLELGSEISPNKKSKCVLAPHHSYQQSSLTNSSRHGRLGNQTCERIQQPKRR